MTDTPITDATIADFRGQHSAALYDSSHAQHGQRVEELSSLYERRYVTPAAIEAPSATPTEFRQKHDAALADTTHPEHEVRVAELTKLHEKSDLVGGDQPGNDLMAPAASPDDYDFSRFKATVSPPLGLELEQAPEVEKDARGWMHEAGLSVSEGEAMANLYSQSLGWTDDEHARIQNSTLTGLRQKYGHNASKAAAAAVKVAKENGSFEFLELSGLLDHWMIADRLIQRATAKGYFKP